MQKDFTSSLKLAALFAMTAVPAGISAQNETVIFSEDFGTAASEKDEPISEHDWGTGDASMFSWTPAEGDDGTNSINVRTNKPSDYDGASADGNLYFKGSASFTITGISTENYSDVTLSFGAFGKNADDIKNMTVSYTDGTTAKEVTDLSTLGFNASKGKWSTGTITGLPAAKSLSITFSSSIPDEDGGIRLDDIKVTGASTSTGIKDNVSDDNTIGISGRNLSFYAAKGKALVFRTDGTKVAEVNAGNSTELPASRDIYIVKAGNKVVKIAVK